MVELTLLEVALWLLSTPSGPFASLLFLAFWLSGQIFTPQIFTPQPGGGRARRSLSQGAADAAGILASSAAAAVPKRADKDSVFSVPLW